MSFLAKTRVAERAKTHWTTEEETMRRCACTRMYRYECPELFVIALMIALIIRAMRALLGAITTKLTTQESLNCEVTPRLRGGEKKVSRVTAPGIWVEEGRGIRCNGVWV